MSNQIAAPTAPRRLATTPAILRLIKKLGYRPTCAEIARATGINKQSVGFVLRGDRRTRTVQRKIARWARVRVDDLFNPKGAEG